ncbi:SCP2 sterol-binding domain-containing protein [Deinococcus sp. QL22]|uniref:SCP2 sterol-binding domain-containing protein n=1 Tax=Deinococcus sp. QL22 TaxID=2939437 RepID=UPI0020179AF8|nr:SCP2 sterol-binding domain-containing protein [Deinococcus sp. QL22]UQN09670.1 SCP2 sterol-binding domain-containing protein [Deinococcus sp. QL22]
MTNDAAQLEQRLVQVFNMVHSSPETDVVLKKRLSVTFLFLPLDVAVRVDGSNGQAASITSGNEAKTAPSDLTFQIAGDIAHAFWQGEVNPVQAMMAGQLSIQGSLVQALALSPSLKVMQEAYRGLVQQG